MKTFKQILEESARYTKIITVWLSSKREKVKLKVEYDELSVVIDNTKMPTVIHYLDATWTSTTDIRTTITDKTKRYVKYKDLSGRYSPILLSTDLKEFVFY